MFGRKSVKKLIEAHVLRNGELLKADLGEALRRQGFVSLNSRAQDDRVALEAQLETSIADAASSAFTERYVRLADDYSFEFDGWGAV